jgi:hypothetical protein
MMANAAERPVDFSSLTVGRQPAAARRDVGRSPAKCDASGGLHPAT